MKYDFDKLVDRRNTNCCKWDEAKSNELPMWIADMDFETFPGIQNSIIKRAQHGAFGYSLEPDSMYAAVKGWWERRHHFTIERDWMFFSTGVVATLSACVRKFSTPNENILVLEPCYNIFFNSIVNNGRRILSSDLIYENGKYHIDFIDFEEKCKNPQTSMLILCNPHNPTGNIWTREDLEKIGSICAKYGVLVVSDEIHCDIADDGYEYIPFASVNEINKMNSITAIAPSKIFNVAGLQGSIVYAANPVLRHKAWREINTSECGEGNAFTYDAMTVGFNEGDEWVDELNQYITENKRVFMECIKDTKLHVVDAHATYLLWVDISAYSNDSDFFTSFLREKTGLFITSGKNYGGNGSSFVRINLATQRVRVIDGANRLINGIKMLEK